jgi:hypothetical protein
MNVRYIVSLTDAERDALQQFVSSGSDKARKHKRAQILLAADQGVPDEAMARTLSVETRNSGHTVEAQSVVAGGFLRLRRSATIVSCRRRHDRSGS